jgi:hypothetical protein
MYISQGRDPRPRGVGVCINPTELRPFCVRFMQVWAGITVKGVSFMRERKLSRSKRGKEALGTAVLVSAS